MSDSLRPHGRQHTRLPCALPSPGVCANSCPLSQRCHPIISSSVVFFSCLQSFPALGSFLMSRMSCGMAKKRKKTQRIPSTFFRKKKGKDEENVSQQEAKIKLVPLLHAEKVTFPADCQAAGWGSRWHLPWASNGFPNPSVLASFLPSAIMLFLPTTLPTKFTTART